MCYDGLQQPVCELVLGAAGVCCTKPAQLSLQFGKLQHSGK
jgi:hypothetical protein